MMVTSKHMARKRSLSSLPPCGLSSKNLVTAAVVVFGSLLCEMDLLAVVAFAPVHSRVSSSVMKDDSLYLWRRNVTCPRTERRRTWSISSTLLDQETLTNDIPSIALFASSIQEEQRVLQSFDSAVSSRANNVARERHNDFRRSHQLRINNDNDVVSGTSTDCVDRTTKLNQRNRLVQPISKSNAPKRRISRRCVRAIPIDAMRLENTTKEDRKRLSREEERQLTHKVRSLRRVVSVRDSLVEEKEEWASYHPSAFEDDFPTELQWAEACGLSVLDLRQIMMEGQESRSVLVSANVGLVTSIAKRHFYALKHASDAGGGVGTILTLQDMIQEGNLGLMKAAERFDADRGFRFSTYATYWIRQRILRAISDSSRVIRLPAHVHAQLQKINKARKEVTHNVGRAPSDVELAHFMKMSVDDLRKIVAQAQTVVSLESPIRKGTNHNSQVDERTIGDFIASDAPTPEEDAQRLGLQNEIRAVMNELAERERKVLLLRYGLENGEQMSLSRIANELGISLDQVRHVEAKALTKLRCPQRNYRLKEYVGGQSDDDLSSSRVSLARTNNHLAKVEKMWFF